MRADLFAVTPALVLDRVTTRETVQASGGSSQAGDEGLTFVVERGEAVGLVGSGRSDLMRAVTGESRVRCGTVWIRSQPAVISKSTALLADKTLEENLLRILRVTGLRQAALKTAMRDIVAYCSAGAEMGRLVKDADPATVDRSRLACLLALSPTLLVIDDAKFQIARMGGTGQTLLSDYLQSGGGVLMTSDDPKPLIRTCSRIVWLDEGRILADGPARLVARDFHSVVDAERAGDRKRAGQLRRRFAASFLPLQLLPNETGRRKA